MYSDEKDRVDHTVDDSCANICVCIPSHSCHMSILAVWAEPGTQQQFGTD